MTKIVKKRISKGIKCYEISWSNYSLTTIEPQIAVQSRYPDQVKIYEDVHSKSSKNKTKQKRNYYILNIFLFINNIKILKSGLIFSATINVSNLIDVTNQFKAMDISKNPGKTNKEKKKNNIKGPLDEFVTREKVKDDSVTLSDFECDSVDLNLSDIVNGIIA